MQNFFSSFLDRYEKSRKNPYGRPVREKYSDEEDDDPELDEHFNPDSFDGASDDVLHRASPEKKEKEPQKERSHSMQDLLEINSGASPSKNKQSLNPFHQKMKSYPQSPNKYAHVESKVKNYISGMKEARKIAADKRRLSSEESKKTSPLPKGKI